MRAVSIRTLAARIVAGGIFIAAGAVHLALTSEHFEEGAWQGWLFAVDGLALIGSGLWFVLSRSNPAALTAAGIAILTAVAYLASRTFGLPLFGREPWDSVGLLVTGGELVASALALLTLVHVGMLRSVDRVAVRVARGRHAA